MLTVHHRIILTCLRLGSIIATGKYQLYASQGDLPPGEYVSQYIDPKLSHCVTSANMTIHLAGNLEVVRTKVTIDNKPLVTDAILRLYRVETIRRAISDYNSQVKCHYFMHVKKPAFHQAYQSILTKCSLEKTEEHLVLCANKSSHDRLDLYLDGRDYGKSNGPLRSLNLKISFTRSPGEVMVPQTTERRKRPLSSTAATKANDNPLETALQSPGTQQYFPTSKKRKEKPDDKMDIKTGIYVGRVPPGDVGISAAIEVEDRKQLITVIASVDGSPGPRIDKAVLIKAEDYSTSGCFKLEADSLSSTMRIKPDKDDPKSLEVAAGESIKYTLRRL